jgi:hypothetical protein
MKLPSLAAENREFSQKKPEPFEYWGFFIRNAGEFGQLECEREKKQSNGDGARLTEILQNASRISLSLNSQTQARASSIAAITRTNPQTIPGAFLDECLENQCSISLRPSQFPDSSHNLLCGDLLGNRLSTDRR